MGPPEWLGGPVGLGSGMERRREEEEGVMQRKRFCCKSKAALAEQMLGLLQLWSCVSLGISLGKDDIRSEKY